MRVTDTIKIEIYKKNPQLVSLNSGEMAMPYKWAAGLLGSKILMEIKKRKLIGVRCLKCGKVYFPPRRVCGPCFELMKETVELGLEGTVKAFTVVNFHLLDPNTGKPRPIPYTYGYINIDGSDTTLAHFINEIDESKLKVGMRVRAVFKDECIGSIQDIKYFEIIYLE